MRCVFSPTYAAARKQFLEMGCLAGAEVETFTSAFSGPEGEELAVDVATLGDPASKKAFFLCSGTHGVEGFAGSAIQTGLLNSRLREASVHPDSKIVLIHALNPYGFAWLRRFNEDNIDLNRNFSGAGAPVPVNEGYEALASVIAPTSISAMSDLRAVARVLWFSARSGWSATKQAITGGQIGDPRGLFYGGQELSWSAKILGDILRRHGHEATEVVFLDVHTGLGRFATSEIILNSEKRTPEWERATAIWGPEVKTTKASESVSADLFGTLKLAVPGELPNVKVTAASIEFGTYSPVRVLRALRAENWLHHFGDPRGKTGSRIKTSLLNAFNPPDQSWQAEVCRQGLDAAERALRWLEET